MHDSRGQAMRHFFVAGILILIVQVVRASAPAAPSGFSWVAVPELTDEFDGSALDSTKWDDYHPHWSGRAPSQFKQGNAYVTNGYLNLKSTMRQDPSTVADPNSDIWVDAAACVSKGWSARPGYYYEARMKASALSMTSSFWFRVGKYSEVDVIEHVGDPSINSKDTTLPYQYHANTHCYGTYAGLPSVPAEWRMATRGRDEFHTYGFWWKDPTNLWFYHNDVKMMEITPSAPFAEDLKMIFDTEVFTWDGLPLPANLMDDTKNTMLVDWVRTYRMADNSNILPYSEIVQAEDFNAGGEGVGYHDTTTANQGGQYRPAEGVDLELTTDAGGGYNVGWTADGEWLEYTIGPFPPGIDTLALRTASINSGRSLRVDLDGSALGSFAVPDTGGWQSWDSVVISNLNISAGAVHTLRVTFEGGGVNLNYLELYGAHSFAGWRRTFAQDIGGMTDDFDGDRQNNLYEYALNGDPVDPATQGAAPLFSRLDSGTMQFIHVLRNDDASLVYSIDVRSNLTAGIWSPAVYSVTGIRAMPGAYDQVTNSIPVTEPDAFYRLKVSAGGQ